MTQVLSCEFCEAFKNTYFIQHARPTASAQYPIKNHSSLKDV